MYRTHIFILLVLLHVPVILRADEGTAEEQYKALVEQFQQLGGAGELAGRFLDLASRHPEDPVAIDALLWVLAHVREGDRPAEAAEILTERHLHSERLVTAGPPLVKNPSLAGEKLLRVLLEKSPHRSVRARACFHLAEHLAQQRKIRDTVQSQPAARRRVEQFYGRPFARHLAQLDDAKLAKEIEELYERLVRSYGDVDSAMKQEAEIQLLEIRHLSIGRPAMEIDGEDIAGVRFKLSDYRGKVVVLNFWGHW
jgi:hypothetical protein